MPQRAASLGWAMTMDQSPLASVLKEVKVSTELRSTQTSHMPSSWVGGVPERLKVRVPGVFGGAPVNAMVRKVPWTGGVRLRVAPPQLVPSTVEVAVTAQGIGSTHTTETSPEPPWKVSVMAPGVAGKPSRTVPAMQATPVNSSRPTPWQRSSASPPMKVLRVRVAPSTSSTAAKPSSAPASAGCSVLPTTGKSGEAVQPTR